MALERTLAIIKPDIIERHLIGAIISRLEQAQFSIVAMKMVHLNQQQAAGFYAEHEGKPFFANLIAFMTSTPVVVLVLEKENAIADYRALMGKTNPAEANMGTLRRDFALDGSRNSVHGSDSSQSAEREIAYFFTSNELF
ncbi:MULTISPECIES: nucleoside-diphosphate kinase [Gallibacterium]|uniref:Nucleoside diphosphate kinase n=5 Tax=Gallibacterium TaxID=155493 RepID=A0A0A2YEF0_9PAST|nr:MULTISPECIES: nucleoside-diphosphate kinase [Gallibacterium]AEC17732.1 nucleoside diphosphate kinase [Gallibacterium anatis UMN179]KGQ26178.1 nucleoside diphosphate kinase [Gallibacterium anatis CCM5995]KGQ35709.1 nucleoside diphosphate kinase [Gallibacterium anatis]KGQ37359.1 nucleoside diphosphate kinase [Gallibacterium genomosp. 1]KGQ38740.1 nucleoside diphosphate kinase [Gallibacterium anatis]